MKATRDKKKNMEDYLKTEKAMDKAKYRQQRITVKKQSRKKERRQQEGKFIKNKQEQKQMWKEYIDGLLGKEMELNSINKEENEEEEIENLIEVDGRQKQEINEIINYMKNNKYLISNSITAEQIRRDNAVKRNDQIKTRNPGKVKMFRAWKISTVRPMQKKVTSTEEYHFQM